MAAHHGFFQRQASARRNTSVLVCLFLAAVVLITLSVCLVGYFVTRNQSGSIAFSQWLLSGQGLITALAVVILIALGSLIRWADLAGGGTRVAKMVGARPIDPDTRDGDERKFRNIVEEMAIASGVTVPDLYVMDDETSINAFVAGYTPGQAVMVVTHGALTQLSRDELQGVVGHEFSHIFNGDMRLNVRLIALLAGILMIGQIGTFLFQVSFGSTSYARSSRDDRSKIPIAAIGLALLVIGYIGVFFGRLIQAAVSRQRERLADASSVQFTRNPDGIASALFKIGLKGGYLDTTGHASNMNHMCFGESARMKFSSLLASHPPIEDRINAIQPGLLARLRSRFRDTEPRADLRAATAPKPMAQASGFAGAASDIYGPVRRKSTSPLSVSAPEQAPVAKPLSSRVGTVNRDSQDFAIALLEHLPATFRGLLYTRSGAVQLCYSLLVCDLTRYQQQERLKLLPHHSLLNSEPELIDKLVPALRTIGESVRFPALELAMPALRKLDPEERNVLITNVRILVNADNKVTLFELALTSFLSRHLGMNAARVVPVKYRRYAAVIPAIQRVLSLLARAGTTTHQEAEQLYQNAMAGFMSARKANPALLEKVTMQQLKEALITLNRLSPLLKPAVIDACGYCITYDGKIDVNEYELMRLVADQMDCPMPPIAI